PRFDAGEGTVLPFLRWAGVRVLDRLALTHDDGDHTGGARAVLHGTRVRRLLVPTPVPGGAGPGARVAGAGVPLRPCARGDPLRTDQEGALWLELSASGVRRIDWRRERPSPGTAAASSPSAALAGRGPDW